MERHRRRPRRRAARARVHDRRLRQSRPARGPRHRGRRRAGRQEAAQAHAQPRRRHDEDVFAGIKEAYKPEDFVGRLVVCVANLAPRKMKFGMSEGMVPPAGPGGSEVFVITVDEGAVPGQRVH